jgi:hypothetical protein
MRYALTCHPDSRCAAATRVEVDATRPRSGHLALHYILTGKIGGLSVPAITAPARADGLWQHTCFEAFVRASPSAAYYEFNFAPSTRWAAYRFSGYRSGQTIAREINTPLIEVQSNGDCYRLQASLELGGLPDLPGDAAWHLGLSAVIEEASGRKSYWALAHPPGKPDFHHSDCFAIELPAASPA